MEEQNKVNEAPETEIVSAANSLMALNSSEIDTQIATAKKYPRSIQKSMDKAMTLATLNEDVAGSMFYKKPQGKENGKQLFVEGPSVRLAEVIASTWGNIRAESNIEEIGDKSVTAVGMAMDLETNFAVRVRVKRRITKKDGQRFTEDMILTTCNAACSIALREAVFKIVPRALFSPIYEKAKQVAIGNASTLEATRVAMLQYFQKMGVTQETVLARLGKAGVADIGLEDVSTLKGLATAIKDGELKVDEAFAVDDSESKAKSIADEIRAKRAASKAPVAPTKEQVESGNAMTNMPTVNPDHVEEPGANG